MRASRLFCVGFVLGWAAVRSAGIGLAQEAAAGALHGQVFAHGAPAAARVYVRSEDGKWHFAKSASAEGSAVEYRKERSAAVSEMHTTLSAHPFAVTGLKPGKYTVTVERGKEYLPVEQVVEIGAEPANLRVDLKQWVPMQARGWFSGDTHVHRSLEELPNLVMAEDLNVALPLSYWVTTSHTAPRTSDKSKPAKPELIQVDATHVIYPMNTEYEIFTTEGKRHTLGAVFVLNHKQPLDEGTPPVGPIAAQARRQGALLDLDKHSWPWSLMIVPVMRVDLFELANNHVWRTQFGFPAWTREMAGDYMRLELDAQNGFTEWGWIDYGFQTYYALLNCGLKMRPTGGTGSGVHPVPLGFGRVYVEIPSGKFSYEAWMKGLAEGRSFVTTGPMLRAEVAGRPPGSTIEAADGKGQYRVTCTAESAVPLDRIEIVINGRIAKRIEPANEKTPEGAYVTRHDGTYPVPGSGWIAVRTFEARPDQRVRFAHTSPVFIDVADEPIRPRKSEAAYLVRRMEEELNRNRDALKGEALEEYRKALEFYQQHRERAVDD